jgi:cell wall-associated NlpC family hydrolase
MTLVIRDKILEKAKELRDGSKILKYSQTNRLGPDSYDCSGFVTSMYAAAGLPFGNPNTAGILALARKGCPFKEVTPDEAEPGDLIVWMKGEGDNTYDHVAIYDGEQTVKGVKDDAVISTSSTASKENRNTIQEILIKYMLGKNKNNPIHVLKWSLQSKWCEL